MFFSGVVTLFDIEQLCVSQSNIPSAKTFQDLGLGPLTKLPAIQRLFELDKLTTTQTLIEKRPSADNVLGILFELMQTKRKFESQDFADVLLSLIHI